MRQGSVTLMLATVLRKQMLKVNLFQSFTLIYKTDHVAHAHSVCPFTPSSKQGKFFKDNLFF